ncbi:MAG: hypothetical protein JWM10_1970 [Myxococcaceae bacterium]|nr:hypothetical protein [Myxococcaceae bacterium]
MALAAALAASAPAAGFAQTHADWWTPSFAVAGVARVRGAVEADVAFDLRVEGLFGEHAHARLGGFVDARLTGRAELSGAAGLSLALPATGRAGNGGTSVVLSAGGAVHDRDGATPAVLGRLWWGLRAPPESSSHYELALGLWAEARYFPGDGTVDALAGVSVDFYALALPFIYLGSALSPRR